MNQFRLPSLILTLIVAIGWSSVSLAQPPGLPPGGGMMMMGPGGPGGPGGGPWGGGGRGGRDGGGGGGPWGGGGGGFDPSQFISRMDTNGNGTLDPEESQGPMRMMLERMARNNPKMDLSKPIPMSVITEAFQQMRNGGGGPGGPGGPDSGGPEESLESSKGTLVAGFGLKIDRVPVPGFGATGVYSNIKVEDRDLRDADRQLRPFDKNNDGGLDENELKEARLTDSPMQWDMNHDGRLSRSELATRAARRRQLKQEQDAGKSKLSEDKQRGKDKDKDKGDEEKKDKNPFEKSSFRITDKEGNPIRPAGLPEWFTRDDINGDNQVSMNEYGRKWNEETLEDFKKFDANGDGYITAKECLAGNKKGYLKNGGSASSSSVASGSSSKTEGSKESGAPASGSTNSAAAQSNVNASMDERQLKFATTRIAKADKNKDGMLTPDEWTEKTSFNAVDTNKDGKIDANEYAAYRATSK